MQINKTLYFHYILTVVIFYVRHSSMARVAWSNLLFQTEADGHCQNINTMELRRKTINFIIKTRRTCYQQHQHTTGPCQELNESHSLSSAH